LFEVLQSIVAVAVSKDFSHQLSSTYFLVATCISVVGVGTIGDDENVFTQAIVSSQVRETFVSSVAFILVQLLQLVHQLLVVLI